MMNRKVRETLFGGVTAALLGVLSMFYVSPVNADSRIYKPPVLPADGKFSSGVLPEGAAGPGAVNSAQTSAASLASQRLIVKLKPQVLARRKPGSRIHSMALDELHRRGHAERTESLSRLSERHTKNRIKDIERWQVVTLAPGKDREEARRALQQDPEVERVVNDREIHLSITPNDIGFPQLWGMQAIQAPSAWDYTQGDTQVVVAVLDTGVDYTHPDLAPNIWRNEGEIPGNNIDDDGNGYVDDVIGYDFANNDNDPMDDHGHGTHVSGTIGAVGNNGIGVAGVNWNVRIMPIKFLFDNGSGTFVDAIRGAEYAVAMGARIVNMSFGGYVFAEPVEDPFQTMMAAAPDTLFVAAAGNSSTDIDNILGGTIIANPAGFTNDNLISVAAMDELRNIAWFSNWGSVGVDLGAPGVNIASTVPTKGCYVYRRSGVTWSLCSPTGYLNLNGTSMAAPHVAGAAALLAARYPNLPAIELKSALMAGVEPNSALTGKTVTGGMLNVYNAMNSVFAGKERTVSIELSQRHIILDRLAFSGHVDLAIKNIGAELQNVSLRTRAAPEFTAKYSSVLNRLSNGLTTVGVDIVALNTLPQGGYPVTFELVDPVGRLYARADFFVYVDTRTYEIVGPDKPVTLTKNGVDTQYQLSLKAYRNYQGTINISFKEIPPGITGSILTQQVSLIPDSSATVFLRLNGPPNLPYGIYPIVLQFDDGLEKKIQTIDLNAVSPGVDLLIPHFKLPSNSTLNMGNGSSIPMMGSMANFGNTSADSVIYNILLSDDMTINQYDRTLILGSIYRLEASGAADIGGSLSFELDVPTGDYYVAAMADPNSTILEYDESNNASEPQKIHILNEADLTISQLNVGPLGTDRNLDVTYTVTNAGSSGLISKSVSERIGMVTYTQTGIAFLDVRLSKDAIFDDTDTKLGLFGVSPAPGVNELPAYASTSGAFKVTLPTGIAAGDYYLVAKVNNGRARAEKNYNNNLAKPIMFKADTTVDLIVDASLTDFGGASAGVAASLGATVRNNGVVPVSFNVRFVASADNILDANDAIIATTSATLGAGASSLVNTGANILTSLPSGTYYVGAIADPEGIVIETNELNNQSVVGTLKVVKDIDLVLENIAYTTNNWVVTSNRAVSFTVANRGTTSIVGPFAVNISLSADASTTPGTTSLATIYVDGLSAGARATHSFMVGLPQATPTGNYYIKANAQSSVWQEKVNTNNTAVGGAVSIVNDVNLKVTDVRLGTSSFKYDSSPIEIDFANTGTSPAQKPIKFHVYLSTDRIITTSDYPAWEYFSGTFWPRPLPMPGNSLDTLKSTLSITATIPSGTYYLGVIVDPDNWVGESDESDNIFVGPQVTVLHDLDLAVSAVTLDRNKLGPSEYIQVNYTVRNLGTSATPTGIKMAVRWAGSVVDNITLPSISGGGSYSSVYAFAVPSYTTAGSYEFALVADSEAKLAEPDEVNNIGVAGIVTVFKDIDIALSNLVLPATIAAGETITANVTLSNLGLTTSYESFYVTAKLMKAATSRYDDVTIGNVLFSLRIAPAATQTQTMTLSIPGVVPGAYYIGISISYTDKSAANNSIVSASQSVTNATDLMMTSIAANATATTVGKTVTLSYAMNNKGGNASGLTKVNIFLTTDPTNPLKDYLLTIGVVSNIAAGASSTSSINVTMPTLAVGTYYLKATAVPAYDVDATNNTIVGGTITLQ